MFYFKFHPNSVNENGGSNSRSTLGAKEGTHTGSYSKLVVYVGGIGLEAGAVLFPVPPPLTKFTFVNAFWHFLSSEEVVGG